MSKAEGRVPTRPTSHSTEASVPPPGDNRVVRWARVEVDRDPRGQWALYAWVRES